MRCSPTTRATSKRRSFEHQPKFVVLYEDNFNFLSKMCLLRMRQAALTMVEMSRAMGCPVAVCGADVTDHADLYLAAGADACLLGEGEHAMCEVIDQWLSDDPDGSLADIAGVASLHEGRLVEGPHRVHRTAPGRVPSSGAGSGRHRARTATRGRCITAGSRSTWCRTRGCPFHCNWCAKPIWGQRYAMRSARQRGRGDCRLASRRMRPITSGSPTTSSACAATGWPSSPSEVERASVRVPFIDPVALRPDDRRGGRRARPRRLRRGLAGRRERQPARSRRDGQGDHRRRDPRAPARGSASGGIRACFFIQFGYPGETCEDILATIALVRRDAARRHRRQRQLPLPGTTLPRDGRSSSSSDAGQLAGARATWR